MPPNSRNRSLALAIAATMALATVGQAGVLFTDHGGTTGDVDLSYAAGGLVVAADGSGDGYGNGNTGSLPITDVGGGQVGSHAASVFYGRFLWAPEAPNDYINFSTVVGSGRLSFHSDNAGTRVRLFDTGGVAVPNIDIAPSPTGTTLVVFRVEMSGPERAGEETVKIWYNPTSFADVAAGLNPTGSGSVDMFDATNRGFGIHNPQISGNPGKTQYDNIVFGDSAADVLTSLVPPPVVTTFAASASDVASGGEVTISWDVSGADTVEILPGIGAVGNHSDSQIVTLSATTVISLLAGNEGGEVSAALQVTVDGKPLPPAITEIMADNGSSLLDGNGVASDWIEIYNGNLDSLDLSGYYLTDEAADLMKWEFPAGAVLGGNRYLVVFASGSGVEDPSGSLHTNFSLAAGGEYLALVAPDGSTIIQDFTFPQQYEDVSYDARGGKFFVTPTPGSANDASSVTGFVADTKFEPDRGYYDEPIAVAITTATPGASIYFTTDGSPPSPGHGNLYGGPVPVATTTVLRAAAFFPGFEPTDVDSHTYLFASQVGAQGNSPPGYPASWGGGPADYEMDPEVVNASPTSPALLEESLLALPAMSLALDVADMFGPGGIYANPAGEGAAWERAASAELIFPDPQKPGFGTHCGLRIQGKSSRTTETPKHSLSLRFRKEYGPGKLQFPIFKDDPLGGDAIDRFDFLQLRAVSNFSFHHWHYYQTDNAHPNRDGFGRDLYLAMGHHGTHGRWVHLYINGLYWGVFNLHERGDGDHMANYFGGQPEDYDTLKENRALNGSTAAWTALRSIVDASDIGTAGRYAQVGEYLDVDAFIDYVLVNFYVGNRDWGGQNWMASRLRAPGAPFVMLPWDMEFSMSPDVPPGSSMAQALSTNITGYDYSPAPNHVHQRLRNNAAYRLRFADRVQHHCFQSGVLSPDKASELWRLRADVLDLALVAESARWGDHRRDVNPDWQGHQSSDFKLYTVENTTRPVNDYLVGTYFPARRDLVISQLRAKNLFPSIDAPEFAQPGGHLTTALAVDNPNAAGSVVYTTDGSDPFDSGTALTYTGPITLAASGPVRARVLSGAEWSALSEATFIVGVPAVAGKLVVSEIYYNPPGTSEAEEFIEIMNISNDPLDLTGVRFTSGIAFDFADGTSLAAGARLTIGSGTYQGQLDNGGEQITLTDATGTTIESFSYDDGHPWPESPDGGGSSLVRVAPLLDLDPTLPGSWRASVAPGGSPGGGDEILAFGGDATADLDHNGLPDLVDHATGGMAPRFAGGELWISRHLGADDVLLEAECSTDLLLWEPLDACFERVAEGQDGPILQTRYRPTSSAASGRIFSRLRASQR